MYHAVVGKRLIACLNQRDGTNYTVREFFDEVYIPLFFGSPRFLQNIGNSPFFQEVTVMKRELNAELITRCLDTIHQKAVSGQRDMSIFIGGPASNATDTTSGQVSSLQIPIPEEDVYASWIGAALGLTVQGGFILLVDAEDVLLTTYDGWAMYRKYLEQTPNLKPLQVNAWNGQWVAGKMRNLSDWQPVTDKDSAALETQRWVQLLFALSYHYREGPNRRLLAYVYSLGQSNTTLGFVQLNLPEAKRLVDLYQQLFTVPAGMPHASFETLYQTDESFRTACQHTEIGLRALRPQDVFKAQKGTPVPPKATEAEKRIAFDTYQTWIIAMLNKKDLMSLAKELAEALNQFQNQDVRLKNVNKQMVDDLLGKKNRREFIEELAKLLEKDSNLCVLFERVVDELLALSPDNVPLFLTLLRFQYAAAKAKPQGDMA